MRSSVGSIIRRFESKEASPDAPVHEPPQHAQSEEPRTPPQQPQPTWFHTFPSNKPRLHVETPTKQDQAQDRSVEQHSKLFEIAQEAQVHSMMRFGHEQDTKGKGKLKQAELRTSPQKFPERCDGPFATPPSSSQAEICSTSPVVRDFGASSGPSSPYTPSHKRPVQRGYTYGEGDCDTPLPGSLKIPRHYRPYSNVQNRNDLPSPESDDHYRPRTFKTGARRASSDQSDTPLLARPVYEAGETEETLTPKPLFSSSSPISQLPSSPPDYYIPSGSQRPRVPVVYAPPVAEVSPYASTSSEHQYTILHSDISDHPSDDDGEVSRPGTSSDTNDAPRAETALSDFSFMRPTTPTPFSTPNAPTNTCPHHPPDPNTPPIHHISGLTLQVQEVTDALRASGGVAQEQWYGTEDERLAAEARLQEQSRVLFEKGLNQDQTAEQQQTSPQAWGLQVEELYQLDHFQRMELPHERCKWWKWMFCRRCRTRRHWVPAPATADSPLASLQTPGSPARLAGRGEKRKLPFGYTYQRKDPHTTTNNEEFKRWQVKNHEEQQGERRRNKLAKKNPRQTSNDYSDASAEGSSLQSPWSTPRRGRVALEEIR